MAKRVNRTDLTLRNLTAIKRRLSAIEARLSVLEDQQRPHRTVTFTAHVPVRTKQVTR